MIGYAPSFMEDKQQSTWVLVLIGVGKLLKASALLFIAVQAHRLLHRNVGDAVAHWVHVIRIDPGNEHIHNAIHRVSGISHKQLEAISLGSFVYATLFGVEGTGLVLRKKWAEYMTVITTGLLLPMEIYEMFHGHHHTAKIIVFILNVAILIYLIVKLREGGSAKAGSAPILDSGSVNDLPR